VLIIFRARTDCVQWFTGTRGTVQTYNFQGGTQLAAQEYNLCLRQEEGLIDIYYPVKDFYVYFYCLQDFVPIKFRKLQQP